MKKIIASTTIAASLLGGGAAAIVMAPSIAGAQETVEGSQTGSGLGDVLDGLVADGTLTQEQRDSVETALREARPERGQRGRGHRFPAGRVFEDLGIDKATVRAGLAEGLTLGEIADANGSSAEALTDALTAHMTERLDNAVANGRIDEATAAEKQAEIEQRVDDIVNGNFERPERPNRGGAFGGPQADTGEETGDA